MSDKKVGDQVKWHGPGGRVLTGTIVRFRGGVLEVKHNRANRIQDFWPSELIDEEVETKKAKKG